MKQQRGFIALPLMAYAAIAAGAVILAMGIALKIQSSRLTSCKADNSRLEAQVGVLADKLTTQNKAVESWKAAAVAAEAKGKLARAAAEKRAAGLQTERARLEALVAQKPAQGAARTCASGVEAVRSGLKP